MNALMIANTMATGFMFMIWTKKNWYNFMIKAMFLTLLVFNIVALCKS